MIRRIMGLGATTALAVTGPLVLTGAAPANAGTTTNTTTSTASCGNLASASDVAAQTYADRLVRAWGRGDTEATSCYSSVATAHTLFEQAAAGGIHWRRVSTEGAAGTIYVTYRNDVTRHTLVIGVSNVGLSQGDAHTAYAVQYH